jgi:hypothetical protein
MSVLALALKLSGDCPNGTSPRECPKGQRGVSVPNVPLSRTVPLGPLGQSHGGAIDNPSKNREWDGWDRRDILGQTGRAGFIAGTYGILADQERFDRRALRAANAAVYANPTPWKIKR